MRSMRLIVGLVLLCCVLVPLGALGAKERPVTGLVDNMLQNPSPAADFTLTDQHGAQFHMADTKGKVVLMSFIYTHCDDICPFVALKIKDAYQLLGSDAKDVVFVLVTTDPKRDTPSVTAAYSRALGMFDVWHFVGGPADAVQAVWANYGIGVTVDSDTGAVATKASTGGADESGAEPTQGLSDADLSLAGKIIQEFSGGYDVGHSAPFWIVDTRGMIHVGMDADATPADIVTNVRALLKAR